MPVILLPSSHLRRRGAVARRAGRRGRGGNSQGVQRRELADLVRDRSFDLVVLEVPATSRAVRALRRASGTRGELAGTPAPRAGRSRSGSILRSGCPGGTCDAEGRSRAASGVGDAGGTRRDASAVSWPKPCGILPVIWLSARFLRRDGSPARRAGRRGRGGNSQAIQFREMSDVGRDRAGDLVVVEAPATPGAVARRAARRGRGGNSQVRQLLEQADLGRDRAGDLVVAEVPATPRGGRAARRTSGDAGELAARLWSRDRRKRRRS